MNSINKTARMAGFWYLIFIVSSILVTTIQSRLVTADAAATAGNILASEELYRLGFVLDLLSAVFFFLAAWSLYALLKPVNKNLALLFMLLNLGGVAVQCLSDLFLFAPILVLNGPGYLKAFQSDQLQALVMVFLKLHENGFMVAQIFYAAWLFPLGYLVYKSGFLPKFLGILVLADFVCWLGRFFQFFLLPAYPVIAYPCWVIGFLAECGLTLWLLVKGVKEQK